MYMCVCVCVCVCLECGFIERDAIEALAGALCLANCPKFHYCAANTYLFVSVCTFVR